MQRLKELKKAKTKQDLAILLGVKTSFLTHTLYIRSIESQYYQFQIPKRSGGQRTINAPTEELKDLQSRVSKLLLDCIDEINNAKSNKFYSTLAHGFVRGHSIISNARMHLNKKNVLNIDLSQFFDSFNFGRVRGFFIKNREFELHDSIATLIAKIACLNDTLPQGSPCSPVITNLITHSLDIKLAALARRNSATYSRYADDITFSTREIIFSSSLIKENNEQIILGKKLRSEIQRAGFFINNDKTRVQFRDSRQDVTGLIVNNKVNIKSEYWRTARAMCHELFMSGSFTIKKPDEKLGNINELNGMLNFIDSVDKYNHLKPKGALDNRFAHKNHGLNYRDKLNVREKTFSKFLYYWFFYGNKKPTILCEGKTDNIYFKSAIYMLADFYPQIAQAKTKATPYELLVNFIEYSKRTEFLLDLSGGGSHLKKFVERYKENYEYYKAPIPKNPVILLLDNDTGPNELLSLIEKIISKESKITIKKDDIRKSDFFHIATNLYIILTPQISGKDSEVEDFFDAATRATIIKGKTFNPKSDADTKVNYGKNTFANDVIKAKKSVISFDNFKPILNSVVSVIEHYRTIYEKN